MKKVDDRGQDVGPHKLDGSDSRTTELRRKIGEINQTVDEIHAC